MWIAWFLNLMRKKIEGSGLKFIFHWYAQLLIFDKSLFKAVADEVILWTTEKREETSAKSLGFNDNPADKSLVEIKNKGGPRILPRRIPAFTEAHLEICAFKTTLWYEFDRKPCLIFSKFCYMSFCFSLNSTPWCQNLSKAFLYQEKHLLLPNHHQMIYKLQK